MKRNLIVLSCVAALAAGSTGCQQLKARDNLNKGVQAYKDAYYTLGVIAWTQWLVPQREARNKVGMKPEDPGPIKKKDIREELKAKYRPMLDEGVANMQKALDIDKEYDEAMAYMNLLVRYRADLDDTQEEYKKDIDIADNFIQKALATKKIKNERQPKAGGITNDAAK